ncbi:MAG: hypothetical protein ACK4UJ_07575 [Leptonema sp. (in: bacteria)]
MDSFFIKCKPPIKNDIKVYLAGYLARYLDKEYKKQIQPVLLKDLEEMDSIIRKHQYKLGQKSPIYFYARINAEYQMFSLLLESLIYNTNYQFLKLKEPANLFSIASVYSKLAGKIYYSLLFEYIYKRIQEIFSLLFSYSQYINLDSILKELSKNQKLKTNLEEILNITIDDIKDEEYKNFQKNLEFTIDNMISEKEILESATNSILFNFFTQS